MMDDGKPVRMSKRAGNFVTLRDVIDSSAGMFAVYHADSPQ